VNALVYHGAGLKAWEDVSDPRIVEDTDSTKAEYARVPFADTSTHPIPRGVSDEAVLMLADILPTSYEVGAVNGRVRPGDTVAIAGAGPIGRAAVLAARFYSPAHVVAIDLADQRLDAVMQFGADVAIDAVAEGV